MESERLFNITESFRVLLREVNKKTYIAFESDGKSFVIYADRWEKLKPYLHEIDKEFIERCDFKEEEKRVFPIASDLKIVVGDKENEAYVTIELADISIKLNAERWVKFQEIFSAVSDEFQKRYGN